ncbi:MAG TPA: energy transducer TonB [Terriglobales bacterium]|nr:energy transducer TonB [Terriglobales bacterium]
MSNSKNITFSACHLRGLWLIAVTLGLFLTVVAPELRADDKKQDAPKADEAAASRTPRKLVHKTEPVYPQDLKRRSIGGVVKLDLKISASGNVEKVEIVGGNPILADSAAQAVKKWQYAPAGSSSSMILNLEFNPNH